MKRAPKIKSPRPTKRSAGMPPSRHPKTGRFTKVGIGTPQQLPYMPTSNFGGSR